MPPHVGRHNKALDALGYDERLLKGAIKMRKSYKLYNHESCNAHVEIHFDENNNASKIELWSYNTRVCGAYKTTYDGWTLFCTGTYSQTTRRQTSWFSRQPWQSKRDWKLSYGFFKEINEKCDWGLRDATEEEYFCIQDLIWQYSQSGKPCYIYG